MDSTNSLRSLPPRARAVALRLILMALYPNSPRAVAGLPDQPGMPGFDPPEGPKRQRGHCRVLVLAMLAATAIFAALITTPAHAGTWRIDANITSIHTERWARDTLNQRNPGMGVEYQSSRTWAVAGGVYTNSYRKPTVYALAEWTPLHLGNAHGWHMDAGLAGGIATGYTRAEIPCAPLVGGALIRVVAPGGFGLNIFGVPNGGPRDSGFIGFQLSVPLARE